MFQYILSLPLAGCIYLAMKALWLKPPDGFEDHVDGWFLVPSRRTINDNNVAERDFWGYAQYLGLIWLYLLAAAFLLGALVAGITRQGPIAVAGAVMVVAGYVVFMWLLSKDNWLSMVGGCGILAAILWVAFTRF